MKKPPRMKSIDNKKLTPPTAEFLDRRATEGALLRRYREEAGFDTMEKFADKIVELGCIVGLSKSTIGRIEAGKIQLVHDYFKKYLAKAADVDPELIWEGEYANRKKQPTKTEPPANEEIPFEPVAEDIPGPVRPITTFNTDNVSDAVSLLMSISHQERQLAFQLVKENEKILEANNIF